MAGAVKQAERESHWLPLFAPHLSLTIPDPLFLGEPSADFPHHWAICRWLAGDNAFQQPAGDLGDTACRLAAFIHSLQQAPVTGEPSLVARTSGRGCDLIHRDDATRAAIAQCDGLADTKILAEIWNGALQTSSWGGPPTWIHGDIHVGNLVTTDHRITGVLDWGSFGMGDPACDLMVAWSMLDQPSRRLFRDALDMDDATWIRGRAWAISVAVIALPYYLATNELMVSISRHSMQEAVADFRMTS